MRSKLTNEALLAIAEFTSDLITDQDVFKKYFFDHFGVQLNFTDKRISIAPGYSDIEVLVNELSKAERISEKRFIEYLKHLLPHHSFEYVGVKDRRIVFK